MTPLGIGIVGTGNIAGGYAKDAATHPEIRLVAATDLDPQRATAFAETYDCRALPSLGDLLADDEVDIVVNLTVHQAHYEVTKRALEARKHVYSEKPLALRASEAHDLVDLASARGVRLGGSPSTFLGEAQQTAAALIRGGRLGTVRAVYADVSWGRIETWHPAPAPFFDVGAMFDVGVYPLTLVTTMLGPARSVRAWGWGLKPERVTVEGTPFRIGSPDLVLAAIDLEGARSSGSRRASMSAGRSRSRAASSSTATRRHWRWGTSRTSTPPSSSARTARATSPSPSSGPAIAEPHGPGASRKWPAPSPRGAPTGRAASRRPTWSTSSRRRRARSRPRDGRSRSARRSRPRH